jgi:hypothetical protein
VDCFAPRSDQFHNQDVRFVLALQCLLPTGTVSHTVSCTSTTGVNIFGIRNPGSLPYMALLDDMGG